MSEKATAETWKREPFGETVEIPYSDAFDPSQYEMLTFGLTPHAMEDKWFAYLEGDTLYFHRSWTGQPVYQVKIERRGEDYGVSAALISRHCFVSGDHGYEAELLRFLIQNLLLRNLLPFPVPANMVETAPNLYQHNIAGTGYHEKRFEKRRWWQVWK